MGRSWLSIVAAIGILLSGCAKAPEEKPQAVTYRLKWLYNTSVVGSLYAKTHGFFQEKGLEVTIKEGGPERDAIKELELGHAQFGTASADQVIRALSKGSPIVVIAQIFQENPLQWIFRPAKTPIHSPQDFRGKTIGITYGGNDETIMKALLSRHGIAVDMVTLFSVRFDYTPFYVGQVHLWPVYRNAEGIVIGEKLGASGEVCDFFNPAAFGIRFVANSIITTQRLVKENPELVTKFIQALLRGWREALDPKNEDKAVETIRLFDRDTAVETIRKQLSATRTLVKPEKETEIGKMDREAWEQTEKIMLEQKLIPQPVHVSERLIEWGHQ